MSPIVNQRCDRKLQPLFPPWMRSGKVVVLQGGRRGPEGAEISVHLIHFRPNQMLVARARVHVALYTTIPAAPAAVRHDELVYFLGGRTRFFLVLLSA